MRVKTGDSSVNPNQTQDNAAESSPIMMRLPYHSELSMGMIASAKDKAQTIQLDTHNIVSDFLFISLHNGSCQRRRRRPLDTLVMGFYSSTIVCTLSGCGAARLFGNIIGQALCHVLHSRIRMLGCGLNGRITWISRRIRDTFSDSFPDCIYVGGV